MLKGINLHKQLNLSFADNFPSFTDPETVFAFPNKSANGQLVTLPTAPLATLPLQDYISGSLDILYYGPVSFGTPAQVLEMDIDTGSADLWVTSDCDDCTSSQFDADKSTTMQKQNEDFAIAYVRNKLSSLCRSVTNLSTIVGYW